MFGLESATGLLNEPNTIVFFMLFVVFMVLAYKVVKLLMRAAMIAAIAGAFPVIANVFFGLPFEISIGNIIRFAMLGAEVYFTYHLLESIGKVAELITKPFNRNKNVRTIEKVIIMEKDKDKNGKKES
jgi:hypothetical protein